jgi:hypothetical protein
LVLQKMVEQDTRQTIKKIKRRIKNYLAGAKET